MKKRKVIGSILFTFLFVGIMLTGCNHTKEALETPPQVTDYAESDSDVPDWKRNVSKKKVEKQDQTKEEAPLDIVDGDLEKNFEKALQHVTICGKKVSFPLTLKKLGKGFTIKKEPYYQPEGNDVMADLYYEGEKIAEVWIDDGERGNIKEKNISLITFRKVINSNVKFGICGVNFDSSWDYITEIWGEGQEGYRTYCKNGNEEIGREITVAGNKNGCPDWIIIVYKL